MAKIAVDSTYVTQKQPDEGTAGALAARPLAEGHGWRVDDMLCTAGPRDRPFEECHQQVAIAVVIEGSFQYRSRSDRVLMTPGSLLLGEPGQSFECGHEHGVGDRCVSFHYEPEYYDGLMRDAALPSPRRSTPIRLPPVKDLAPIVARTFAGVSTLSGTAWQELGIELAVRARRALGTSRDRTEAAPAAAIARVTDVVRAIERDPADVHTLDALASSAGLSPFHFLRTFEHVTGVTPHQYVQRQRLLRAASRLMVEPGKIVDIALDTGFGDVSNFNRAFRKAFGVSPREYRRRVRT